MIRTLIADDHNLVRSSIRLLLEHANTIKVEWEATDGLEALEKIRDLQPDVAILDISMPHMDGIQVSEKILELGLGTQIIILSMHSDPVLVQQLLKSGVRGYLVKDSLAEELVQAVNSVMQRKVYISSSLNFPDLAD
jgi:DNA-binding NarL/FixJ family response regulator